MDHRPRRPDALLWDRGGIRRKRASLAERLRTGSRRHLPGHSSLPDRGPLPFQRLPIRFLWLNGEDLPLEFRRAHGAAPLSVQTDEIPQRPGREILDGQIGDPKAVQMPRAGRQLLQIEVSSRRAEERVAVPRGGHRFLIPAIFLLRIGDADPQAREFLRQPLGPLLFSGMGRSDGEQGDGFSGHFLVFLLQSRAHPPCGGRG